MDRERAKHFFWIVYPCGFVLGLLARLTDPPQPLLLAAAATYLLAVAWFGGNWLVAAIRDGSFRRAVPEYASAFLGLLIIALGCGAATLVVLLAAGADFTVTDVSTGATLGTFAVLGAWWLLRGRRASRA